ncbi:MAG: threonine ammonia-lyase, biosynthetic, partial [Pseudomonadota bacterium]
MPEGATTSTAHGAAPAALPGPKGRRIAAEYLKRILTARVYDVARETALDPARTLSRRIGNHVLLKR